MSRMTKWGVAVGSVALALAAASVSASAADASASPSYHGTWYEATAPTCTQVPVTGRWSVTLAKDGTAIVSVTLFMEGELHAAWGGSALGGKFTWTESARGYDLTLGPVEITIDGDQVRFDIPERYPDCDALVRGTVAHTGSR